MRYVLYGRKAAQERAADVRKMLETNGVTVVRWKDQVALVEYDGALEGLRELLGGQEGWLVSEQRVYKLCGFQP